MFFLKLKLTVLKLLPWLLFLIIYQKNYAQWEKIQSIPYPYSNGFYLEIFFLDSDRNYGWACGYKGYIIRTTDGGETWKGTTLPYDLQLESIIFVNKSIGYVSGQGTLFKSTDGGSSWFDITPDKTYETGLWGNYFVDEFNGLVIGDGCDGRPQKFYKTTDGGMSWTLFSTNIPNTGMTDLILYFVDGLGYAVSSGRLWKTTNGGITWSIFSISGQEDWQEELSHKGNTFLVPYSGDCTGGGPGGMRITTNNGLSWLEYSTGQPMFGTFLLDESHGWACGHDRNIYFTSNSGRTWELRNCGIEPGIKLDDLWFINDSTGWVVGEGVYRYYKLDTLKPEIQIKGPITKCSGDSVVLTTTRNYRFYRWSTGETTKSITVKKSGSYWVFVGNTVCDTATTDAIDIYFYPEPEFDVQTDKSSSICEGDTVTLFVSKNFVSYKWSTGESQRSILVTKSGKYSVIITDSNGCSKVKDYTIEFLSNPKPVIVIDGSQSPCEGDSTILIASTGYADYEWFEIQSSKPKSKGSNKFIINESGTYYVKVTTSNGCINFSDSINIDFRLDTNKLDIGLLSFEDKLDFGDIIHPDLVCKKLTIANISWVDIIINKLKLFRNITFSIPQSQLPLTIPAKGKSDLIICFNANGAGLHVDTLLLPDVCSNHIVPLRAEVEPQILNGITRCGFPVRLVNGGNRYEYIISALEPHPNPASNIIHLPYNIISSSSNIPEIKSLIYDSFGNQIAEGLSENYRKSKQGENYMYQGKFIFNINNFTDGLYFIILFYDEIIFSYPVIISH